LLYNPSFQHLLPKLIESKDLTIAKEIQKALKQSPASVLADSTATAGSVPAASSVAQIFRTS